MSVRFCRRMCVLVIMMLVMSIVRACFTAHAELRGARCRHASTRSVHTVSGSIARLPSARRTSSSGTPASMSAPRIMSPAAPEKQSKYRTVKIVPSYAVVASRVQSRLGIAPASSEREVARVRQDDVIDDVDAHDVAGARPCDVVSDQIVGAGRRIARRVIVEEHDGGGRRRGGLAKHLARVHDRRVERADRDEPDANDAVLACRA